MRTKQKNMKIRKESRIRIITPAMAGIFGVLGFVGLSLSSINAFAEVFEAEQGLSFTQFQETIRIVISLQSQLVVIAYQDIL